MAHSVADASPQGSRGLPVAELYPQDAATELLLGIVVRRCADYHEL
jgi:hypothetical protein